MDSALDIEMLPEFDENDALDVLDSDPKEALNDEEISAPDALIDDSKVSSDSALDIETLPEFDENDA